MAEFDHISGKIPPIAEGLACMYMNKTLENPYHWSLLYDYRITATFSNSSF